MAVDQGLGLAIDGRQDVGEEDVPGPAPAAAAAPVPEEADAAEELVPDVVNN